MLEWCVLPRVELALNGFCQIKEDQFKSRPDMMQKTGGVSTQPETQLTPFSSALSQVQAM